LEEFIKKKTNKSVLRMGDIARQDCIQVRVYWEYWVENP